MNRRKAHTLVELAVATTLTVTVAATGVLLYAFAASRTAEAFARLSSVAEASRCLEDISATIEGSTSCSLVTKSGVTALKCEVPAAKVDVNADGAAEGYRPGSVSIAGYERYTPSRIVWFFLSDSTGTFGQVGTILWRAETNAGLLPTALDRDRTWSMYSGTQVARMGVVSEFAIVVDAANRRVAFSLRLDGSVAADTRSASGYLSSDGRTPMRRVSYWRNWRS